VIAGVWSGRAPIWLCELSPLLLGFVEVRGLAADLFVADETCVQMPRRRT
jgi:hypothetical protein